jgi:hypothetical protein
MMAGLSPGMRRFVALALLLLPILASALLVVVPLRQAERQTLAQGELDAHIARLEERLVTREQVLAELRQLERLADLDPRLMQAETAAVAGATLAGNLGKFLQEAGGLVDTTQVLEPVLDSPLQRIGVRLRGAVDLQGLRSFLHMIESAEPLLTVERLTVHSEDLAATSGLVLTEIIVVGYARVGLNAEKNDGRTETGAATSG